MAPDESLMFDDLLRLRRLKQIPETQTIPVNLRMTRMGI